MSSIHYKFRSSVDYDTITFDGQGISLSDLRDAIMTQKKIAKSPAYTLEITNAQSKEVYSVDDAMVPKNSSVIIKRVPVQRTEDMTDGAGLNKEEAELTEMALAKLSQTANLADAKASEDDKIKAMLTQSAQGFDPSTYQRRAPPNYVCYRCGGKGHFVRYCPTQGDPRYNQKQFQRAPSGIPREYYIMKMKQEQEILDGLRSSQGKNSQFTPAVSSDNVDHSKVPEDLLCPICKKIFTDAVVTPCCGESYCDDCIRTLLVENDLVCKCGETTSPDNLIGNRSLRTSVSNFRNNKPAELKAVPLTPAVAAPPINSYSNGPTIKEEDLFADSPNPTSSEPTEYTNGISHMNVPSPARAVDTSLTDSPQRVIDQTAVMSTSSGTPNAPTSIHAALPSGVPLSQLPVSVQPMIMSSNQFPGAGGPALYTNVQGSIRQGYPNVIGAPTIMQQPAGLVHLNLPPGAQFVQQRLVPIAVPGQRYITPVQGVHNQIRIGQPPTAINRVGNVSLDLNQRLVDPNAQTRTAQLQKAAGVRKEGDSPMPLSEEDFYKWQMKFKTRPSSRRSRSRSRSRSPGTDKHGRRRRHRSVSPTDSSGKGRYDSPAEDSSQERKSKKSKKDKLKKRHRDSSQESLKGDSKSKNRGGGGGSGNDKKSKRRLPEHIKREVAEFDFDNELEFDEELRKLKTRKKKREGNNLSANENDGELSSPEKQPGDESRSRSPSFSKESETATPNPENGSSVLGSQEEVNNATEASASISELTVGEGGIKIKTEVDTTTELSTPDVTEPPKPKRKTKIVKKKVIRLIKVSRRKGSNEKGKIISQTIIEHDVKVDAILPEKSRWETGGAPNDDSSDNNAVGKRKGVDKKVESPTKKVRIDANHVKGTTKRGIVSAKSAKLLTPEKKKELIKKRQADKSAAKAKQLLAEVKAKKEAEKKQLLQNARTDEEEKRKKQERYLLLKKKAKEQKLDKQKKAAAALKPSDEEKKLKSGVSPKVRKEKTEQSQSEDEADKKPRPDQHFYKPGDSKLKSISEMTKKQLQEGGSRRKEENDEELSSGDVLKSKVSSMKTVIRSGETKRRMIKTSVSEEEIGSSQSSDERSTRRVVKLDSKKSSRSLVSKVEKPESKRSSSGRASSDIRRKEDDRRREKEFEREKEYERELREKKHLHKLQKEREEMLERERQTLKEKERLERKLEKERQIRKEMEREKHEEDRKRDEERREKRKLSRGSERDSDDDDKHEKRLKKNKTGYVIQILDSSKENANDGSDADNERDKKKRKRSKKKKEKKKKKKREEESNESEGESSDDEEEEKSKKKKRSKHKKKHKKHSSKKGSRKHKKKSKRKKRKQDQSEEESEAVDEDETEDTTTAVGKDGSGDEDEGSTSDSKDGSEGSDTSPKDNKDTSSDENDGDGKASSNDEVTAEKDSSKHDDDEKAEKDPSSKEAKSNSPVNDKTEKSPDASTKTAGKIQRKRSTLGEAEDLELDYNDDVMNEDVLLYGDLNFGDDEQTNPESMDEKLPRKSVDDEECEEGEILDDDELFTTAEDSTTSKTQVTKSPLPSPSKQNAGSDKLENGEEDEDDIEIDDAIDNAMSKIGLDTTESEATTAAETSDHQNEADETNR